MNLSKINIKQLENILSVMPASQNIMLVGKHGIGKSEILTHYFADKGIPVVALFLGQMSDPGDLIGLPRLNEENRHHRVYAALLVPRGWETCGAVLGRAEPRPSRNPADHYGTCP